MLRFVLASYMRMKSCLTLINNLSIR